MTRPKFIDIYAVAKAISEGRKRRSFIYLLKQLLK